MKLKDIATYIRIDFIPNRSNKVEIKLKKKYKNKTQNMNLEGCLDIKEFKKDLLNMEVYIKN